MCKTHVGPSAGVTLKLRLIWRCSIVLLLIALLLIAYFAIRPSSLFLTRFHEIVVGDTSERVEQVLGEPHQVLQPEDIWGNDAARRSRESGRAYQYRYNLRRGYVWTVVFVIDFDANDRVLCKRIIE